MPIRFAFALLLAALPLALAGPCLAAETSPKDGSVALEVRLITVAEDFFERIGVDFESDGKKVDVVDKGEELRKLLDNAGKEAVFLNEDQARKFLEALGGDVRTNIMYAPKLLVAEGKEGSVRCMKQQFFVTGLHPVRQGEQLAMCPKTETFSTGFELAVQPTILKDKHAVTVKIKTALRSLDGEKPTLFPVVVPVTPVSKDGKPQQPVAFKQFIQQPRFTTLALQGELTIPDGGSALLGGWKRVSEGRCEYGPPVLSKVPYVNRLFKNVGYSKSVENVLVMVTARIAPGGAKEIAQAKPANKMWSAEPSVIAPCSATEKTADSPPPKWVKKMKLLLASYHQACADGRLDEARKLAQQALTIDPTCFSAHPVFGDFGPSSSHPQR